MKFDVIVLIIAGFSTKWSEGFVSGVNPRLVRTEPTNPPKVEENQVESFESSSHRSITSSRDDNTRIIFPSSSHHFNRRINAGDSQVQSSIPSDQISSRQVSTHVQLSRISLGYPFERDDEDDRPIWNK